MTAPVPGLADVGREPLARRDLPDAYTPDAETFRGADRVRAAGAGTQPVLGPALAPTALSAAQTVTTYHRTPPRRSGIVLFSYDSLSTRRAVSSTSLR
jgi:hypothetical protein